MPRDRAELKRVCPLGQHVGPIFEHIITQTRIEIDPKTLKPKEDTDTETYEAEVVEQYREGWECDACGIVSSNPFHFEAVDDAED